MTFEEFRQTEAYFWLFAFVVAGFAVVVAAAIFAVVRALPTLFVGAFVLIAMGVLTIGDALTLPHEGGDRG